MGKAYKLGAKRAVAFNAGSIQRRPKRMAKWGFLSAFLSAETMLTAEAFSADSSKLSAENVSADNLQQTNRLKAICANCAKCINALVS